MLVFLFYHSNLQLAYTTQAWILKFKTCAMQAKHMKCTFKCTIQVHELAPPTCVLKILVDPFPLFISLIYQDIFMFLSLYDISPPFSLFLLLSLFLSPFVINDHIGSKCRQVESMNANKWGENHFPKFGSIQNTCQRHLTRFNPRTSFFTPPNKGYFVPC